MTINDLLQTTDARVWAAEFMRINPEVGASEELMIAWFSNAIMCGWDQRYLRSAEYKRSIRCILHPWYSPRRYFEPVTERTER